MAERATTDRFASDERAFAHVGRLWWLVLLRGLVPGVLALVLVLAPSLSLHGLARVGAGVVALGSALELALAWQLRGVVRHRVLWLIGGFGLAAAGLLLATASVTLALLLSVMGAWLGVRGLAMFWVALLMQPAAGERLLLLAVALLSVAVGVALLFWTQLTVGALVWPAVLYALPYAALHAVAARRIRNAPAPWVRFRE